MSPGLWYIGNAPFSYLLLSNTVPGQKKNHREFSKSASKLSRSKKFFNQNKGLSQSYLLTKKFFSSTLCFEEKQAFVFRKFQKSRFFPTSRLRISLVSCLLTTNDAVKFHKLDTNYLERQIFYIKTKGYQTIIFWQKHFFH